MTPIHAALRAAKTRIPALDAHLLLAHVLGCDRAELIAHPDRPLSPQHAADFAALVERAADDVPVAYLLGHKAWYDLTLRLTPAVLVPRPETELLLERALAHVLPDANGRAVDVGTGSGALAVGLKKHRPALEVHAVDLSAAALEVARTNAAAYGAHIHFHQGDLLVPLLDPPLDLDVIMANLPYIPSGALAGLAVAKHEPLLALDGGADGLALVRRLLEQAAGGLLRPGGLLLLEIGAEQGAACAALVTAALTGASVTILQDYAGLDRIVVGMMPA